MPSPIDAQAKDFVSRYVQGCRSLLVARAQLLALGQQGDRLGVVYGKAADAPADTPAWVGWLPDEAFQGTNAHVTRPALVRARALLEALEAQLSTVPDGQPASPDAAVMAVAGVLNLTGS